MLISSVSSLRIAVPSDLRPPEARQSILLAVQELEKHYSRGLPRVNPVTVCVVHMYKILFDLLCREFQLYIGC